MTSYFLYPVGKLQLSDNKLYICMKIKDNNKMKKKYHTVGAIPKSNIKIVERRKVDTPNTHIHDSSLSWFGTGTSIKSGGAKLVFRNEVA